MWERTVSFGREDFEPPRHQDTKYSFVSWCLGGKLSPMTLAKRLEALNKRFWYAILRLILRNEPASTPLDPERIRKILIFRYDAIGDMVVTLPSVDIIRKNHPAAEVAMVVLPKNIGIIKNDSRVGTRHIYGEGLGELIRLVRETRR